MPKFDHFSAIAPFYDRIFGRSDPQKRVDLLNLSEGMRLLDAGGGTGRVLQGLNCPVCSLVVADESLGMLREAVLKPAVEPVRSLVEALPFADRTFDRVIMVDTLHHVIDAQSTISELFRVLAVGGVMLVEEPDIRYFGVKLIAVAERLMLMRSHFLSPDKITSLFSELPVSLRLETQDSTAWVVAKRMR